MNFIIILMKYCKKNLYKENNKEKRKSLKKEEKKFL
jgi:hypothetical protein